MTRRWSAEVQLVARLREHLRAEIARWELGFVYEQIELPLVMVLGRMEARGIRVDVGLLRTIAAEFTEEAARLDAEIQKVAGHEFKVNSSAQLRTVLFDELGLTPGKKIKSGYSTDATTLESIVDEHPIIPLILRYREVEKLRGTYGAPLIDAVGADGRIHATFHQTVARTGRLSSENPNLHNIPVRTSEGRRLRYAFLPSEGWQLAVADYNQIELRILAHLSQDSGLLAAFASHEDVHRTIAASVFGVAPEQITHEQREQAKAVSYGLAYGMEAFGLSPASGGERVGGQGDHGQVLRGLPDPARLHGRDDQGGPRQGLLAHRVRADPSLPRPRDRRRSPAPGGRAPGHELGDPGPGRRRLQVRAGATRPSALRRGARGAPHPPGARRGARRGAAAEQRRASSRSSSTR